MSNNLSVNINTTKSSYISEDISIFNDDYIEEHRYEKVACHRKWKQSRRNLKENLLHLDAWPG